jgi:hypothetical protein
MIPAMPMDMTGKRAAPEARVDPRGEPPGVVAA